MELSPSGMMRAGEHPIPTSSVLLPARREAQIPVTPEKAKQKNNQTKVKFYFLFLWSLIADQSWPFRLELPASSCSRAGFQATLWMRAAHPMHCPLLSSCLPCWGQSVPLTLLEWLLWESRGCNPATGNEIGFFSCFTRPPGK